MNLLEKIKGAFEGNALNKKQEVVTLNDGDFLKEFPFVLEDTSGRDFKIENPIPNTKAEQQMINHNIESFGLVTDIDTLNKVYGSYDYALGMLEVLSKMNGGRYVMHRFDEEIFDVRYVVEELMFKLISGDIGYFSNPIDDIQNVLAVIVNNISTLMKVGSIKFSGGDMRYNDSEIPSLIIDVSDDLPFAYVVKFTETIIGFKISLEKMDKDNIMKFCKFNAEIVVEFNTAMKEFAKEHGVGYEILLFVMDHLSKDIVFNKITNTVYSPYSSLERNIYLNKYNLSDEQFNAYGGYQCASLLRQYEEAPVTAAIQTKQ